MRIRPKDVKPKIVINVGYGLSGDEYGFELFNKRGKKVYVEVFGEKGEYIVERIEEFKKMVADAEIILGGTITNS